MIPAIKIDLEITKSRKSGILENAYKTSRDTRKAYVKLNKAISVQPAPAATGASNVVHNKKG